MYLCYIDESGTPDVPGNTSHFVLAGLAIPIDKWREADRQITEVLARYDLANSELHTAWINRPYFEQSKIPGFAKMDGAARRSAVARYRAAELLRLQKSKNSKAYQQARKNYRHTEAYVHLTHDDRKALLFEVAECVSKWDFAVVFVEAIDKLHFDPVKTKKSVGEQAFEQIVSRFQHFLTRTGAEFGLIVHDNNETVAKKHTEMMRHYQEKGTLWAKIESIIETPLFVDSKLTRMVQIADLISFSVRRYVENGESTLLEHVIGRADVVADKRAEITADVAVGIRHYSNQKCVCRICAVHQPWRVARTLAVAAEKKRRAEAV